ncbi:CAAD domain-containing protein [Nostoc sp. MG11]|uniref:CAAD domain-containing protein n=1 Tax=Nostoc sp. MG11 TaxID=2721166 RepID=UPI001866FE5D|nr:CAAD domain-containing protein [Nostoc sp. MG11]
MESQVQQSEFVDVTSPKSMTMVQTSEPGNLSTLPSANKSSDKASEIGRKISNFLERLPEYVVNFFNEYKLPVISFALLVVGVTGLRVLLAIVDAINDIPLVCPFFELIGIGYVTWSVFRYFLKASTRQELAAEMRSIKEQIAGENVSEPMS